MVYNENDLCYNVIVKKNTILSKHHTTKRRGFYDRDQKSAVRHRAFDRGKLSPLPRLVLPPPRRDLLYLRTGEKGRLTKEDGYVFTQLGLYRRAILKRKLCQLRCSTYPLRLLDCRPADLYKNAALHRLLCRDRHLRE